MKSNKSFIKREVIHRYKYTLKNVNLREEKSTDSNIITVIPKDSKLELLYEDELWASVIYNSKQGYVYKDYLSTTKYPWSNLNLRKEPSTQADILTVIPKGSRIEVLENNNGWSKIVYKDKVGYVFDTFLSNDGRPPNDLDYKNFYVDMDKFIIDNNIQSPTDYLLITDLKNKYTYIYEKVDGKWQQQYKWICTVGKSQTPTITGTFYINGRKPGFGTDKYQAKYATRIKGGYYYHSILYDGTGSYVIDSRLGEALSHGCIRLETNNAKWIYENIPNGSKVIIH